MSDAGATWSEEEVLHRIVEVFRVEIPEKLDGIALGRDTRLREDLGLDSGYFIGLMVALEDEFDAEFDDGDISEIETLGDLARLLMRVVSGTAPAAAGSERTMRCESRRR